MKSTPTKAVLVHIKGVIVQKKYMKSTPIKAIVSGPLMPCWETTCIDFLLNAHLYTTILSHHFKCLMLFTNLHVCAGPGVGFLNENRTRSWSRSENFSFYRSRI